MRKKTLEIKNLRVRVADKEILKGINLKINQGEIHAVMGPNGSGKSTLAYALMGHPSYQIPNLTDIVREKKALVMLGKENLLELSPDERAKRGLFLAFQTPLAIAGVNVTSFLRLAYQSVKKTKISPLLFYKKLEKKAAELKIEKNLLKRSLNDGFSGGEKKKLEMLQILVLEPDFLIIDEIDTGLDIDALKIVALTLQRLSLKTKSPGMLIITHYQRIFRYLKPHYVHVLKNGLLVASGGLALLTKIEKEGYAKF